MEINFASPIWLWGLMALLPLICLRVWSHLRTAKKLPGLVSPRLRGQLISGSSQIQRWISFSFLTLSLAFLLLALARPQWGYEETETESEGRNLLLAIDTSRSMLATDLLPNRIVRAKLAAKDIIAALPEDRIGLIAFAGRAFLQAPLTVDHDAVGEAIDQLDTDIIPRGGTNLTAAAEVALQAFKESQLEESALVIFSDGEALEGTEQIDAIKEDAKAAGMTIVTVGVGTPGGSIIPEIDPQTGAPLPGVFVKDEAGQVVRTRLDESSLRDLASGGGAYVQLGSAASLSAVVERITSSIATSRQEEQARSRPIERFMWPLSIATGLMIFTFITPLMFLKRRPKSVFDPKQAIGSKTMAAVLAACFLQSSYSAEGMREGFEAFEQGEYEKAVSIYQHLASEKTSPEKQAQLNLSLGAAAYQMGDYEIAAESFAKTLTYDSHRLRELAHYNLGNTLFRKGETLLRASAGASSPDQLQPMSQSDNAVESTIQQWESAIEHYESALVQNEANDKAKFNIEVVKKRIEELKKEQEKQEQEQQQQEQKEEEKDDEEKKEEEQDQEEKEDQKDQQEQEKNQDQEKQQDQNQQGDPEKDEKSEEENQDQPQDQNQEGDPEKDDQGQEQDNKQNPEDQKDPSDPQNQNGDQSQQEQQQNQGEGQPQEPEPPQDGKLEANPNQPEQQQSQSQKQMDQAQQQRNPETGYSPSEARQLLEALADETEVRPILKPAKGEKFKNW